MSRARELQASAPSWLPPRHIKVTLTYQQAQALVEAGEEWPDFTDMTGTQMRCSKRGAKELRTALLKAGKAPHWVGK